MKIVAASNRTVRHAHTVKQGLSVLAFDAELQSLFVNKDTSTRMGCRRLIRSIDNYLKTAYGTGKSRLLAYRSRVLANYRELGGQYL